MTTRKTQKEQCLPPKTDLSNLPNPALTSLSLRKTYRIGRGEQGVLTFEPYKSLLLPHWRFKTVPIAQKSAEALKSAFDSYVSRQDFVGADMARKFIQMGMTRARRYANYAGGRKYVSSEGESGKGGKVGEGRVQLEKSHGHVGRDEKAAASEVFKEVWKTCLADEGYLALKKEFMVERKAWDREEKRLEQEMGAEVKDEKVKDEKVKDEDDSGDGNVQTEEIKKEEED